MTTKEQRELLLQKEDKQADIDHHVPTAGAMTNHILANLIVLNLKLRQTYIANNQKENATIMKMVDETSQFNTNFMNKIDIELIRNGEAISTSIEKIIEYAKVKVNEDDKFMELNELVSAITEDMIFSKLFITRAISLADNENKADLSAILSDGLKEQDGLIVELQRAAGLQEHTELIEDDDF